jgi:hypothetical protein
MGKAIGRAGLLERLGRAAGLSALATATLASGPCGECEAPYDLCKDVSELADEREAGLAATADAAAGGPSTHYDTVRLRDAREEAEAWDGTGCPTDEQRRAIAQLNGEQDLYHGLPTTTAGSEKECCYHITPRCGEGRPFLVHGEVRVASSDATPLDGNDWLDDALMEHASVAAFARLTLQLLAHAAPPAGVRDAPLAGIDELRHADFCFEQASRRAGRHLAPGPLSVTGALDDLSLGGLIESNLLEGCIGETLAAERLRARAQLTDDSQLRAALLTISEDETRHAELAFRILAWCREVAPELTRTTVRRVLREAGAPPTSSERETWQQVLQPLFGALAA